MTTTSPYTWIPSASIVTNPTATSSNEWALHPTQLASNILLSLPKDVISGRTERTTFEMYVKDLIKKNGVIIFPYSKFSRSAKCLIENFHIKSTSYTLSGSLEITSPTLVVNWGSRAVPKSYTMDDNVTVLNKVTAVTTASNKLAFLQRMQDNGVRVPEFTCSVEQALEWVNSGLLVLGRKKHGTCGQDIVFSSESISDFVQSELWTVYKKKKSEYRIHVFDGEVIDMQRKAVRKMDDDGNLINTQTIDFRIRNLANGFVFVKKDVDPPADVILQAKEAVEYCGLNFGAVDVIWNQAEQKAYVLEVNTAPGLEGSTVQSYVNAINKKKSSLGIGA